MTVEDLLTQEETHPVEKLGRPADTSRPPPGPPTSTIQNPRNDHSGIKPVDQGSVITGEGLLPADSEYSNHVQAPGHRQKQKGENRVNDEPAP
jgi:hypothetical protein